MDRLKNHIDTLLDEQEKKRPTEQTGKSWWSLTKTCSICYWSRKKIPPFLGYRFLGIVEYSEFFIFFFFCIDLLGNPRCYGLRIFFLEKPIFEFDT